MRKVKIWTDGSCDKNPGGPGGWAAIVEVDGLKLEMHERCLEPTTSNRMELTAAIRALSSLREWCEVDLYTDSQYLQRGAKEWMKFWHSRGWVRRWEEIPNADLWKQIWDLCLKHSVRWHWIPGHNGHEENTRCDFLASRK